jgi:hypothetical protein
VLAVRGAFSVAIAGLLYAACLLRGLPDAARVLAGAQRPRALRVRPVVLRDEAGRPAVDPALLAGAVVLAARVLRSQAGVRVVTSAPVLLDAAAPEQALRPGCGRTAAAEPFTAAGAFFRRHAALGAVTVFGVADVAPGRGKAGCSLGPFARYVVVDGSGLSATDDARALTVAHELGHACGLPHLGAGDSLMRPGPRGRRPRLARWQRALLRTSRHVMSLTDT